MATVLPKVRDNFAALLMSALTPVQESPDDWSNSRGDDAGTVKREQKGSRHGCGVRFSQKPAQDFSRNMAVLFEPIEIGGLRGPEGMEPAEVAKKRSKIGRSKPKVLVEEVHAFDTPAQTT